MEVDARDNVDTDNIANRGEEVDKLFLLSVDRKVSDKNGATIHIILAKKFLVGLTARNQGPLFDIKCVNAVAVILTNSLLEDISGSMS